MSRNLTGRPESQFIVGRTPSLGPQTRIVPEAHQAPRCSERTVSIVEAVDSKGPSQYHGDPTNSLSGRKCP